MPQTCTNPSCTASGTKRCARCKAASYCSSTCQTLDWQSHKPICLSPNPPATTIATVKIHSSSSNTGGAPSRYSTYLCPTTHAIFTSHPVPISLKIGYPLLVYRDGVARGGNQHATWLMIDPESGFAPAGWQGGVGDVIVARADGEGLDVKTLGAVTDYISDILDAFGDGGVGAVRKFYDRARLDRFIADHLRMQEEFKAFQGGRERE